MGRRPGSRTTTPATAASFMYSSRPTTGGRGIRSPRRSSATAGVPAAPRSTARPARSSPIRTRTAISPTPSISTGGADLATTLMPWVAARDGKVDVVFYGSTSAQDDTSAVWNTYDSQFSGGSWSIDNLVSNTPNRIGAVCTQGSGCAGNANRELLDLFEVAEDPLTDKAAIIYTSSQISIYTTPDAVVHQLPEVVLAFEQ